MYSVFYCYGIKLFISTAWFLIICADLNCVVRKIIEISVHLWECTGSVYMIKST